MRAHVRKSYWHLFTRGIPSREFSVALEKRARSRSSRRANTYRFYEASFAGRFPSLGALAERGIYKAAADRSADATIRLLIYGQSRADRGFRRFSPRAISFFPAKENSSACVVSPRPEYLTVAAIKKGAREPMHRRG